MSTKSASGGSGPTVSVLVPCHNESGTIEDLVRGILELEMAHSIILVDDGSTDNTAALCATLARNYAPRVQALLLPTNQGKNRAVRHGAKRSDADVIVVLDADFTIDPCDLHRVIQCCESGSALFVYGSRFILPMESSAMSVPRRVGNRIFASWVSQLVGQRITDVFCGLKAIPRHALVSSEPSNCRWGDLDLVLGAASHGLDFQEVPISYRRRRAGASKMNVLRAGLYFLWLCMKETGHALFQRPPGPNQPSRGTRPVRVARDG